MWELHRFFFVIYNSQVDIFGFYTVGQTNMKLWEISSGMFTIIWHFIDQTINQKEIIQ